ncbi:hypothetical protein PAMP_018407 [Pampus punctatissimus]
MRYTPIYINPLLASCRFLFAEVIYCQYESAPCRISSNRTAKAKRLIPRRLLPALPFIVLIIAPLQLRLKSGGAARERWKAGGATSCIMWSVFFVFLSYLDRNVVKGDFLSRALEVEKESKEMFSMINGTFCAKMSTVGENFLYQVSDGAEVVRSVVSPAGKLVNCSVVVNQMEVKSFMHECRLGLKEQRAGWHLETRVAGLGEAKLMCREFKKSSERTGRMEKQHDTELQDKTVKRSKRGFTYPGTLWCGAGNMADNYDQLGQFAETDSCCRTHDHCPHVIHAFSSKYGYTNFKLHSICHCDCDNALKGCLREVNDSSSRVVGQAFFNVIGVPCFEFAYEEQCVERHWYGVCKQYEKLPIAVLKEAVPYDFGGIDVIDQLTVAPPAKKDSKKSDEEEKTESTSQSTMSGPEEPSLRNVVTAAEDFIKVLATVSTSQSSTNDSDKGETQSSEKKKKKNTGKKKKTAKKRKGKGKGRKQKQKTEAVVKIEEGATVSPPGSKAEDIVLSNFISESHKHVRSNNRVGDNDYEFGGKDERSNEVMKDEPSMVQKSPVEMDEDALTVSTEEITLSTPTSTTTVNPHKAENRQLRKGRRKKGKKIPLPLPKEVASHIAQSVMNTTDNLSTICAPDIITRTPTAQPEQQSFGSDTEKRPVVSTASAPIVIHKVKRNRSKEKGERERRKKRRRVSLTSLIVVAAHENASVDNLRVIPLTRVSTVPTVPATELHVSHRPDIYGGRMHVHVTALNPSLGILKRQRSKERALRKRRRKTALSLLSESPLFHNNFENVLHILPTPDTRGATSANSRPTEEMETHSEPRLVTTAGPSIITKRHRQTIRQQRKPKRKAALTAFSYGVSIPEQTEHTTMTFTTTPSKVATTQELNLQRSENSKSFTTTSATPFMSPIQLSIEKAKEQFSKKMRRKAAQSNSSSSTSSSSATISASPGNPGNLVMSPAAE